VADSRRWAGAARAIIGVAHVGQGLGRSSMGAGLATTMDDRAKQRLVTARGSGRASGTRGGGGPRRRWWPERGRWARGKDDGRAAVGCGRAGAAQADLRQAGRMRPDLD
jgi:hypothetical protein